MMSIVQPRAASRSAAELPATPAPIREADAAQIAASHAVMGLDTQLIADGTYFIVEEDGAIAGCGGWSFRATLYGGDHSKELRDPAPLDPAVGAAAHEGLGPLRTLLRRRGHTRRHIRP